MPSWFLIVYLKDREKSARAGRRVLGGTMAFGVHSHGELMHLLDEK